MVGKTPCRTAPAMLNTSPISQTIMNCTERASAELDLQLAISCGVKTMTVACQRNGRASKRENADIPQQAIDIDLNVYHISNLTIVGTNGLLLGGGRAGRSTQA